MNLKITNYYTLIKNVVIFVLVLIPIILCIVTDKRWLIYVLELLDVVLFVFLILFIIPEEYKFSGDRLIVKKKKTDDPNNNNNNVNQNDPYR